MNEDRIEGKVRAGVGKVEQFAGRVTGDTQTRVDGVIDEVTGRAQDMYGQAKDAAADAYEAAEEGAARIEDTIRDFVETRPYTTAVIALCAGLLIGRMGNRS
jgi:uncharacterized protein YjbJ (UPF0337 family)